MDPIVWVDACDRYGDEREPARRAPCGKDVTIRGFGEIDRVGQIVRHELASEAGLRDECAVRVRDEDDAMLPSIGISRLRP